MAPVHMLHGLSGMGSSNTSRYEKSLNAYLNVVYCVTPSIRSIRQIIDSRRMGVTERPRVVLVRTMVEPLYTAALCRPASSSAAISACNVGDDF